jgi:putative acetyltransferase
MQKDKGIRLEDVSYRGLRPSDNPVIAGIIRSCLSEFGADRPGTVFTDPTTDDLYNLFMHEGARYFIADHPGGILGGGGIFPSKGLPPDTCELVKMYLRPEARGIGLGRQLIASCIKEASSSGYRHVYIETMPELRQAVGIYEKFGFRYLRGPLGDTGHFGCDVWMLLDL